MSSRFRRILASPVTALLSAVVFVFTVWLLPISLSSPSAAGRFIAARTGKLRKAVTLGYPYALAYVREGSGFKAISLEDFSTVWGAGHGAAITLVVTSDWSSGWWAPTGRTREFQVVLGADGLTSDEETSLRNQFFDFIEATDAELAPEVPALRSGTNPHFTILCRGWVHNGASLASFSLFAASSFMVTRRAWRSFRAPAGCCPQCGYDLGGLPHASPCPECGSAVVRDAGQGANPFPGTPSPMKTEHQ